MSREVVITGVGAVTPLGIGSDPLIDRWSAGESGICVRMARSSSRSRNSSSFPEAAGCTSFSIQNLHVSALPPPATVRRSVKSSGSPGDEARP